MYDFLVFADLFMTSPRYRKKEDGQGLIFPVAAFFDMIRASLSSRLERPTLTIGSCSFDSSGTALLIGCGAMHRLTRGEIQVDRDACERSEEAPDRNKPAGVEKIRQHRRSERQ